MALQKGSQDDSDQEDNSFNCEVCNIRFDLSKAYFAHIYSVSHLQRVNAVESQAKSLASVQNMGNATSAEVSAGEKNLSGLVSLSQKSSDVTVSSSDTNVFDGDRLHLSGNLKSEICQEFPHEEVTGSLARLNRREIPIPTETELETVAGHSNSQFVPTSDGLPSCTTSHESSGKIQMANMSHGTIEMEAALSGTLLDTTETVNLSFGTVSAAAGALTTGSVPAVTVSEGMTLELDKIPLPSQTAMEIVVENSTACQYLSSSNASFVSSYGIASQASVRTTPVAAVSSGMISKTDDKPFAHGETAPSIAAPVAAPVEVMADDKTSPAKRFDEMMAKKDLVAPVSRPVSKLLTQQKLEEVSCRIDDDSVVVKLETDTKAVTSTIKPLLSPSNTGASIPKMPLLGNSPALGIQRSGAYEPPTAPAKVPLLASPSGGFVPNSAFEPWNVGGTGVPLLEQEPVFHHGTKIPLLRSPPVSPYGPFPPPFPVPGSTYFLSPLLPTPAPPVRGPTRPRLDMPVPAALGGRPRPPNIWEPENSNHDPKGFEVMDYHHGFSKNPGPWAVHTVQRETERYVSPLTSHQVEPLIAGNWIQKPKLKEEPKMNYTCQVCDVNFDDLLMNDLHLAGLRHRQMTRNPYRKPLMSSDASSESKSHSTVFKVEEDADSASHSPAFVTGLLDTRHGPVPSTSVAASSSGCFSELEKKLQVHSGAILGVDYLTEYRYLGGRLEYACDLCDVSLESVSLVVDHISSVDHLLQFMCYNNPEVYKSVSEKAFSADVVREAAEKIMKTTGRQCRVRVKMESDDMSSDGRYAWIELKDSLVKPVSALPGHRMTSGYATVAPRKATVSIDDIYSLLRTVSLRSCLASNRPPSQTRPLRRMDFLEALGKFEIQSSKDAEICLQLANFLTIAVISFRRQMLPSLNAVDATKIEEKLKSLHKSAKVVAMKTISAVSLNDINLTKLEMSAERSA